MVFKNITLSVGYKLHSCEYGYNVSKYFLHFFMGDF